VHVGSTRAPPCSRDVMDPLPPPYFDKLKYYHRTVTRRRGRCDLGMAGMLGSDHAQVLMVGAADYTVRRALPSPLRRLGAATGASRADMHAPQYAEKSWCGATYTKYLKPNKVKPGQASNLLDLLGGRYYIPDDQYDDFLKQYATDCDDIHMALVEQKNEHFPMLFDIDHIEEYPHLQPYAETIAAVRTCAAAVLKDMCGLDAAPRCVRQVKRAGHNEHFIFASILVTKVTAAAIWTRLVELLGERSDEASHPPTPWGTIIDLTVLKGSGLRMLGSYKPWDAEKLKQQHPEFYTEYYAPDDGGRATAHCYTRNTKTEQNKLINLEAGTYHDPEAPQITFDQIKRHSIHYIGEQAFGETVSERPETARILDTYSAYLQKGADLAGGWGVDKKPRQAGERAPAAARELVIDTFEIAKAQTIVRALATADERAKETYANDQTIFRITMACANICAGEHLLLKDLCDMVMQSPFRPSKRAHGHEHIERILRGIKEVRWQERASWCNIGYAMKRLDMCFDLFDTLSRERGGDKYGGTEKFWEGIHDPKCGYTYLKGLAEEDCPALLDREGDGGGARMESRDEVREWIVQIHTKYIPDLQHKVGLGTLVHIAKECDAKYIPVIKEPDHVLFMGKRPPMMPCPDLHKITKAQQCIHAMKRLVSKKSPTPAEQKVVDRLAAVDERGTAEMRSVVNAAASVCDGNQLFVPDLVEMYEKILKKNGKEKREVAAARHVIEGWWSGFSQSDAKERRPGLPRLIEYAGGNESVCEQLPIRLDEMVSEFIISECDGWGREDAPFGIKRSSNDAELVIAEPASKRVCARSAQRTCVTVQRDGTAMETCSDSECTMHPRSVGSMHYALNMYLNETINNVTINYNSGGSSGVHSSELKNPVVTATEKDAAKHVLDVLAHRIKKDSDGKLFVKASRVAKDSDEKAAITLGVVWEHETTIEALAGMIMELELWRSYDDKTQTYHSSISGELTRAMNVARIVKILCPRDAEMHSRLFCSTIGKLCFEDGVYDFKTRALTPYADCPEVFTTVTTGRNFPHERNDALEREVHRRVLDPIFDGDLELKQVFLREIARGLAGHVEDKRTLFGMGARNSGKGLLQDLIETTAGAGYREAANAGNFYHKPNLVVADEAKNNSWMTKFRFARFCFINEVDEGKTLSGNEIKRFSSGGDSVQVRTNNVDEYSIKLQAKLCVFFNAMPKGVSQPDAVRDHAVCISFPVKFVNRETLEHAWGRTNLRMEDKSVKTDFCKRTDVGDAFLHILFDAYGDALPIPATCRYYEDGEADGHDLGETLLKYIVPTEGGVTKLSDFEIMRKQCLDGIPKKNILLAIKGLGGKYTPDQKVKIGVCFTRAYTGFRLRGTISYGAGSDKDVFTRTPRPRRPTPTAQRQGGWVQS
jgi:hypothetical protein